MINRCLNDSPRSKTQPIAISDRELSAWQQRSDLCEHFADILEEKDAKLAGRVRECRRHLKPYWDDWAQEYRLQPFWKCGVALCPGCNGRQERPKRKYIQALPALMAANPDYSLAHAVFTVKNVPVGLVNTVVKHFHQSFARLSRSSPCHQALAYLRAVEFTISIDGSIHPHLHVLFLVEGNIDTTNLTSAWHDSARLNYEPTPVPWKIAHTDADILSLGYYIAKPPVKLSKVNLADKLGTLTLFEQIRGVRLFSAGGVIKGTKARELETSASYEPASHQWAGSRYVSIAHAHGHHS